MTGQKTVVITGCSAGGVGAAIAFALAKRGHYVFATARNPSKIPAELTALSVVTAVPLDVASSASVIEAAATVARATQEKGLSGIDVLINNAGIGYTIPLLDVDIDKAKEVFEANFWGPLRTVQAFSDLLIQRKGRVINVSSVGSNINLPWIGIYSSSKAALNSLTNTLRVELSSFDVSVTTLMLGTVATPFADNGMTNGLTLPPNSRYILIEDVIGRWVSGEDIPKGCSPTELAESVVKDILGSKNPDHLWRGPQSSMGWFISRFMPWWLIDTMAKGNGLTELSKRLSRGVAPAAK
ncbi:oxidoreductase [Thozetella sp. PMI_491]|nr:oxidoreductase [Thozetella sp. PMI_491]